MPTIEPIRKRKIIGSYAETSLKSDNNSIDCDDRDPDFIPPLKKFPKTNKAKSKAAIKTRPTKQERLQRLKKISEKYGRFSGEKIVQPEIVEQHVALEQPMTTQQDTENLVNISNFDDLFDIYENTKVEIIEKDVVTEPSQVPSINCVDENFTDSNVDVKNHIINLVNIVTLLRKQVARIEFKISSYPNGQSMTDNTARYSNNGLNVEADDLLDFDSTLAREGLPLKTCVEANDFDFKLGNQPQYRTKVVCIFVILNKIDSMH